MTQPRVPKVQRLIEKELNEAGLSYEIKLGHKHRKLYIEGVMTMVFSHGAKCDKDIANVKSYIRRAQERKNAN